MTGEGGGFDVKRVTPHTDSDPISAVILNAAGVKNLFCGIARPSASVMTMLFITANQSPSHSTPGTPKDPGPPVRAGSTTAAIPSRCDSPWGEEWCGAVKKYKVKIPFFRVDASHGLIPQAFSSFQSVREASQSVQSVQGVARSAVITRAGAEMIPIVRRI